MITRKLYRSLNDPVVHQGERARRAGADREPPHEYAYRMLNDDLKRRLAAAFYEERDRCEEGQQGPMDGEGNNEITQGDLVIASHDAFPP